MSMTRIDIILSIIMVTILVFGCKEEPMQVAEYDESEYLLAYGHFPEPLLEEDNLPLTVQKVQLGRMLFYEPLLSRDNSQSCASCHNQKDAFSDTLQFSLGVQGLPGKRQAMSVFNLAWNTDGFFWDGRAELLRHQALLPIEDELEMDETHENVIVKLQSEPMYRDQFIRAFGDDEITTERMSLAMEQFMLSIVSNDSKYDRYLKGEDVLTDEEERGRQLYFGEFNPFFPDKSGADCEHCHGGINFENDSYLNNGLDSDANFTDLGREDFTGDPMDRAKFKVTSLRNIAVTPPYMHDGRFKTLEEVIDHYNDQIVQSSTLDPALGFVFDQGGLGLTEQDKADLIAFLHTLTDETFLTNIEYSNPFE